MKQLMKTATKVWFTIIAFFAGTLFVLAQDNSGSSVTTTTHTEKQIWYASPWVWVVGAAIFILILVALLRGGGSSTTITRTTTTESE